jgi:hypothetical protein
MMCLVLSTSGCAYVLSGYHYEISGRVSDATTGGAIGDASVLLVEASRVTSLIETVNMSHVGNSDPEGQIGVDMTLKQCRRCIGPPAMWNTEARRIMIRVEKPGFERRDFVFRGKDVACDGLDYVIDLGAIQLEPTRRSQS